tara:strand:- start:86 stop:322 length:237 start_codon:yes stop_codon:yes gene_type:complete
MSDNDIAKQIVGLLIDSTQKEAKKHLPDFIQDNWIAGFTNIIEAGLYHAWISIVEGQVIHIKTSVVDIIDERTGGDDA